MEGFMNGFAVIFVPALILLILGGTFAMAFGFTSIFESIVASYRLQKQILSATVTVVDRDTREYVLKQRARSDAQRIARLRRQQEERDARMKLDLGDEDLTVEMFQQGAPKFLLCKNPIDRNGKTLFFREVLRGVAISEGAQGLRDAKVYWTPLRHYARRMIKSEAEAWVKRLPDSKSIFIVSDEPLPRESATAIENRIVEKLTGDGLGLDDLAAAAEASA